MAARTTDSKHYLSGDWTILGVADQMDLLRLSLQKLDPTKKKRIHVDCRKIEAIDMSGLQLIHVWLELVKRRGMEAQLHNLPDHMHHNFHLLRLGQCLTDSEISCYS